MNDMISDTWPIFGQEDGRFSDMVLDLMDFADILNEGDVRELMGLTGRITGILADAGEERF